MKDLRLGEVISVGAGLYVISGFIKSVDGPMLAFELKPFIGDPESIADINAALAPAPITKETEPPAHFSEEMKAEWRKDRDFLLGDSW